ncbi:hypothetical protein [Sphingobium fuliginis]|uniref:hypothetical protein n=1 Tax=Sphingobium fuliginis (strain ATCC 27551) TaxID=336203 RepID=UPI00190F944D|nr:hypothetical protein [Sphingobium fuliginis]
MVARSRRQLLSRFFLEDAARIERDVRAMGFDPSLGLLDEDEIAARQTLAGGVIDRAWRWLTSDPIAQERDRKF